MKRLSIERIVLSVRGVSGHRARELAGELPRSLVPALRGGLATLRGSRRVARLDAPRVAVRRGDTAARAAAAVSAAVSAAVGDGDGREG